MGVCVSGQGKAFSHLSPKEPRRRSSACRLAAGSLYIGGSARMMVLMVENRADGIGQSTRRIQDLK